MHLNLGTILQASEHEHPERVVLRLGDFTMTYAQLARAASRAGFASAVSSRATPSPSWSRTFPSS